MTYTRRSVMGMLGAPRQRLGWVSWRPARQLGWDSGRKSGA